MLQKIRQVQTLFREMDKDIDSLKKSTGVGCPEGCILCCLKPGLEANILEFLPLAWHLVSTGQHEEVIGKIESGQSVCVSLNTLRSSNSEPGCRFYSHRGAICRLFGSSVLRDSKTKRLSLYSCKVQKEEHASQWGEITDRINLQKNRTVVSDYYFRMMAIDPKLSSEYHPINESIYIAISKVALFASHRPKPNAPFGKAV